MDNHFEEKEDASGQCASTVGLAADSFYLQDTRGYVGNDVLFWAIGGGYTTDVSKAEIFTREAAFKQHACRYTDRPWPKWYIDGKTRPAVDHQYIRYKEAMAEVANVI